MGWDGMGWDGSRIPPMADLPTLHAVVARFEDVLNYFLVARPAVRVRVLVEHGAVSGDG
jgi:hypothetical protein